MRIILSCIFSLILLQCYAQDSSQAVPTQLSDWDLKTDSLRKLNHLTINNYTRGFLGFNNRYGVVGMNTALVLSKYRKFDMGVGTGFEYYNRGMGFIQQIQVPVYAVIHVYVNRMLFVKFEPGMMYPIAGRYDVSSSITTTEFVRYTKDELLPAPMFNIGLGLYTKENLVFTVFARNQYSGTIFPFDKRFTVIGISLGGKL